MATVPVVIDGLAGRTVIGRFCGCVEHAVFILGDAGTRCEPMNSDSSAPCRFWLTRQRAQSLAQGSARANGQPIGTQPTAPRSSAEAWPRKAKGAVGWKASD
jgi:hypothetical protein